MFNFLLLRDKFATYSEEKPGQANLILSATTPIQLIAAVSECADMDFEKARDLVDFGGLISNVAQDDFNELINWKAARLRGN